LVTRGVPVASYSVGGGRAVADLSRSIGFTSHLNAPLKPADVVRAFGAPSQPDLSARLCVAQPKLRRVFARAGVFAELMRAANASLDPQKVAETIVTRVAGWFPLPAWAVVIEDQAGGLPSLFGARLVTADLEGSVLAIGAWIQKHPQAFLTARMGADRRIDAKGGAALAFPLVARGRTIGALVGIDRVAASRDLRLAPAVQAGFAALLESAALAIDNALRVQRAEALSVTDDLTQLYNSRYLSLVLRRETKRASRSGRPLSLVFIDLDGFKGVNDVHGHLCGSRTLVEVAAVIRTTARETDVVSRFGGDEFALVLPDTGSEGAVAVGERIRDRIAEREFLTGEGLSVRLTASVGVATLPDVAASADGLMRAADQAMDWVKEHGKNGIYVAQG
jgi:diguanylate cyclase (GGDEF)-like protein